MEPPKFDADIVVVGGGLVGFATAICAARRDLKILHLSPPAPEDRRTSALMGPSVDFMRREQLIADPADIGTALTKIRIIDATDRLLRAPETLFDSAEAALPAFGWNFANRTLMATFSTIVAGLDNYLPVDALFERFELNEDGYLVHTSDGRTFRCRLVVGADGKGSPVRVAANIGVHNHSFNQSALVCDLTLSRPLEGTSVEFHYPNGPFTLVPAGDDRANLVWIDSAPVLQAAKDGGETSLLAAINAQSKHLFGEISLASPGFVFPLATLTAEIAGRDGIVLAGEAAHAFPPIGAQGLNLGLRDVADLMASIEDAGAIDADWPNRVSQTYARRREGDLKRTGSMVDALFRSLLTDMLPAQAARAGGLWALKLLPSLRRRAFSMGMGEH
ncbi:FAD-dependent monooxygenase [Mariluticola halotolerans]|uniref:FAD-dependent monooxygenase n=1 Tax=Mariluticola halotolerans TaxID=2909283 RepID=UPI0026E2C021|nr:FAD-dependent monooxygenase [Mariluticola halotolerans]UJQ95030.1 FAD-dependent monooxygenase [Mariluticola halotolerans]